MIVCLTKSLSFAREAQVLLAKHGSAFVHVLPSKADALDAIYGPNVRGVIVDLDVPFCPRKTWIDALESLGRRTPVVVLLDRNSNTSTLRIPEAISVCGYDAPAESILVFKACGALGKVSTKDPHMEIPIYTSQIPVHMLQKSGTLSLVTIDANAFQKIALHFGLQTYHRLQETFQNILRRVWGARGFFRSADIVCRRSASSNIYYVFLDGSRTRDPMLPGMLEATSDRISRRVQEELWREFQTTGPERIIPSGLRIVPDVAVGYASVMFNPCIDIIDTVEHLIDSSAKMVHVQLKRLRQRKKELIHCLSRHPGLVAPQYQGVFHLPNLTRAMVTEAEERHSLVPLRSELFGFESLVRINTAAVKHLDTYFCRSGPLYLTGRLLTPEVLFSFAYASKSALEFDQACLTYGIGCGSMLPGQLMVNILPANLYYIDRIRGMIESRGNITLEISESAQISDFDQVKRMRTQLNSLGVSLAADDFGKGYADLDRIFHLDPDLIKLDRTLVADIHDHTGKQAIVRGMVESVRGTRAKILGEGVEKWEEAVFLQSLGVDLIQGFLLHRPQEVHDIQADLGFGEDSTLVPLKDVV